MSLILKADVKLFLGIPTAVTVHDNTIDAIIARIEAEADRLCNRTLAAGERTEYYNGDGSDILLLNNYPVNSMTSLHDDPDRDYDSDTLISTDDYVVFEECGKIELDGLVFSFGKKNIKVVYNAGYGTGEGQTTPPKDLLNALIKLASADFIRGKTNVEYVPGASYVDKAGKLREEAEKALELFRRISFA